MPENSKLQKLEEIIKIVERDVPSTSEVAELVATIIQVVKETKEFLEKQAIENKKDLNSFVNRATEQEVTKIAEALDVLEKKAEKVTKSINEKTKLDLDSITKNLYLELSKLRSLIPKEANFTEVYGKIKEVEGKIPKVPDEIGAEKVRDKLESLEGEERLKIKSIYKLREELDELKKKIDSKVMPMGGGSSGGGRIVKTYDLSDSLNGVLKTFSLPAFWRVLVVHLASSPFSASRPTTDYTTDASAMTITFTAQIDAATQLATGQSCLIEYSE